MRKSSKTKAPVQNAATKNSRKRQAWKSGISLRSGRDSRRYSTSRILMKKAKNNLYLWVAMVSVRGGLWVRLWSFFPMKRGLSGQPQSRRFRYILSRLSAQTEKMYEKKAMAYTKGL